VQQSFLLTCFKLPKAASRYTVIAEGIGLVMLCPFFLTVCIENPYNVRKDGKKQFKPEHGRFY